MSLRSIEPGMKLAVSIAAEAEDDYLTFLKQMGIDWVVLWTTVPRAGAAYYLQVKRRFANAGLRVFGFGNGNLHNQDAIVLGLEIGTQKLKITNTICAPGRGGTFPTQPMRTWPMASGVRSLGARAAGPALAVSMQTRNTPATEAPIAFMHRSPTGGSTARKRSGRTSATLLRRLRQWPKNRVSALASTPTIRPN